MPTTTCPYCCTPFFHSLFPIEPPQHGYINKVHELGYKIRQLDRTIAQLSKDRTELQVELKGLQSFISILPEEILLYIFQLVCSQQEFDSFTPKRKPLVAVDKKEGGYNEYGMKLVLTRVSANWRRIVMSAQQLWTSVRLHIRNVATQSTILSLRRFLEYSGQLPLTLSIHFSNNEFSRHRHLIHPFIDSLLVKNLWRIKVLYLKSPRPIWFSYLPRFVNMTHIFLADAHRRSPNFSLSCISSLSEFTLVGRSASFSSPYLAILNLDRVPLNIIFYSITKCPNLRELHCRSPYSIDCDEYDVPPKETFTLQRLEVLEWTMTNSLDYSDITWEISILNYIHAPSLRALSLIQPRFHPSQKLPEFRRAVARFFARLPATLLSLEFVGIRNEPTGENNLLTLVNHYFRDNCHIESLTFDDCHFRFLVGMLQNLTCFTRIPHLYRITVDEIFWPKTYIPSTYEGRREQQQWNILISRTFLEMVEKRLNAPERRLALYMTHTGRNVEWLSFNRSELAELKRDRQLDIFIDSKPFI